MVEEARVLLARVRYVTFCVVMPLSGLQSPYPENGGAGQDNDTNITLF